MVMSVERHGFFYKLTPQFLQSMLGRLALVQPYTKPKSSVYGSAGIPIRRSIGGPEPAIMLGSQSQVLNDPRGNAGGSPLYHGPTVAPLVKVQDAIGMAAQFANPGAAVG